MKLRKSFFIFVASILISLQFDIALTNDISKNVTAAESQVDQTEKDLIKEQNGFKSAVKQTLIATKTTRNLLKNNKNLSKLVESLNQVSSTLKSFLRAQNFTLSNFNALNRQSCKKLYTMINKLEYDLSFYLKTRKETEDNATSTATRIDELKLEYFANFIFLNKTQGENVLAAIATNERLLEKIKLYGSALYSASCQIANILYDIKVVKYKICVKMKHQESKKQSSKISKKDNNPTLKTSTARNKRSGLQDSEG